MRINDPTVKRQYIVDMLENTGEAHTAIVGRLLSQGEETPRSFKSILRQRISSKPELVNDVWAFREIVRAICDYIHQYHAPASTKQYLYNDLYSLCKNLAQSHNIADYQSHLNLLPEPVAEDLTIALVKDLHAREGVTKADLARLHNVDERTIQNKIQALDGNSKHKPLRIGGFAVHVPVVHSKKTQRDEVLRYHTPNTMNPLVLQLNTTQAATLLQSLHFNHQQGNFLPLDLAVDIWCQLSDYTRKRIREVFCRNDPDFAEFLDWIHGEVESLTHHFMSESEVLDSRDLSEGEMMLIADKGGEICDIELKNPLRSRSRQRVKYDHDQHRYYAVSADEPDGERLYFTEEEVGEIRRCL